MTPQSPYPYAPPTPPRKSNAGKIIGIAIAVVLALCVGGTVLAVVAGADDPKNAGTITQDEANRRAAAAQTNSATPSPAATTKAAPAAPTSSAPPPKPTKTTEPPVEIEAGIYVVGEDMPAGRYKVTSRADAMCYWARLNQNGDIIDNSLAGGFPSFTTKPGEQLETSGCPPFRLVKRR